MCTNARGNNWLGNLDNRNVVRLSSDGLDEIGVERCAVDGGSKRYLALADLTDLDEALELIGDTGGLVESGQLSLLGLDGGH